MSRIAAELVQQIASDPDLSHNVIVRVHGDLESARALLESNGFRIRHKLRLINGFSGSATGKELRRIADEPWLAGIEPDRSIGPAETGQP